MARWTESGRGQRSEVDECRSHHCRSGEGRQIRDGGWLERR